VHTVKTIGASGQIALGKEYAGRHVLVDELEKGVWVIKLGDFVPESERWLHKSQVSSSLDRAIRWAEKNPPRRSSVRKLAARRNR
jgi:hypothetical protein